MAATKAEQQKLVALNFEEGCLDIEHWAGWPGDHSDRADATWTSTRELWDKMIAAGFTKERARDLIHERTTRAIFRQPLG